MSAIERHGRGRASGETRLTLNGHLPESAENGQSLLRRSLISSLIHPGTPASIDALVSCGDVVQSCAVHCCGFVPGTGDGCLAGIHECPLKSYEFCVAGNGTGKPVCSGRQNRWVLSGLGWVRVRDLEGVQNAADGLVGADEQQHVGDALCSGRRASGESNSDAVRVFVLLAPNRSQWPAATDPAGRSAEKIFSAERPVAVGAEYWLARPGPVRRDRSSPRALIAQVSGHKHSR